MTWFTSTKPSYLVKILHLQVLSERDGLSESTINDNNYVLFILPIKELIFFFAKLIGLACGNKLFIGHIFINVLLVYLCILKCFRSELLLHYLYVVQFLIQ